MIEKKYISDIDGLRAVAVMAVIFYHVGYKWIPGGFVGVDIFFVISGYLITKNILFDVEHKNFSFFDFYVRRARRLFPALFVMLLVSIVFAYQLFSPVDLARFGQSLLYANMSLSNFFFMSEAGYFDAGSDIKPLLHTWSLSVEEQFYLIWPFLLVGLLWFRNKRYLLIFLLLSTIISAYASFAVTEKNPSVSFFMLPFRTFEFSIGALVIWAELFKFRQKYLYDFLTMLGLGLILYSLLIFTHTMQFPGYAALVPSIGAGLVIYASRFSVAGSLLRHKVAVGIGLISYSIYLVHWPFIVFYKYWKFGTITHLEKMMFIAASFILGYVLWRYVEKPWRLKKADDSKTHFTFIVPALMLLIAFIAANIWGYKGFPDRYPEEFQISTEELMVERNRYWSKQQDADLLKGQKGEDSVIIMGNSYGIDLIYALKENDSKLNIEFLSTTFLCSNFGTIPNDDDQIEKCSNIKNKNFANQKWKTIDRVYLHDNWTVFDLDKLKNSLAEIRALSHAPIYVFGPKMDYAKQIPDIVKRHMRMSSINTFSQKFQNGYRIEQNEQLKSMFANSYYADNNIYYVDMMLSQCGEELKGCEIISSDNQKFLFFDGGHFTKEGAYQFGKKLKKDHPELF
ncbi:MAG: acyltransferase family protein [Campylobacterota bacterium]|nr:acyltransferase family protein [Campylobacterota bacterium]